MKRLILFAILFSVKLEAQQNVLGGTPVQGINKISRTDSFVNTKINDLKTIEKIQPEPSSPTGNSSEVGVTSGQLSISLTGAANYSIPISVPPGINGFIPKIAISYDSQSANGIAGYGWNIAGISKITRIPSTKFHDGLIDPVDFDSYDRFAIDGQRIIIKNGTGGLYGGDGTIYETENYSNIKITSFGVHPYGVKYGPKYFTVEYPDGSIAQYGNSYDSFNYFEWNLTFYQNPQGVRINYNYDRTGGESKISYITYGALLDDTSYINTIKFFYKDRQRKEQSYIGGINNTRSEILDKISIYGNRTPLRNYFFEYEITSLGYERLIKITEKSGDNTKSYNPTVFTYNTTPETISYSKVQTDLSVGDINYNNSKTISGDFNGDGKMDFILYPTTGLLAKSKYFLFNGINSGNLNIGAEHNVGAFDELFPISWLGGNSGIGYKLMPIQGWCVVKNNTVTNPTTSFTNYSAGGSTLNPILLQEVKNYIFPKINSNTAELDYSGASATYLKLIPKKYISGDFNGDGISDVLAIEYNTTFYINGFGKTSINSLLPPGGGTPYAYNGQTYLVNLDSRLTNNFVLAVGQLNFYEGNNLIVDDVNGDGKTDLLIFCPGSVKVYSLDENNQFQLLWTTNDQLISTTNPILGDFNGDGKTDFILPKGYGYSYAKYLSTGIGFEKSNETYDIPFNANGGIDCPQVSYIIPTDFNKDGKTDLILAKSSSCPNTSGIGFISISNYKNTGTNFVSNMYATTENQSGIGAYALPIFLNTNKQNFKSEINFITNNKIIQFNSDKDFSIDQLLKTITLGNGVKDVITYSGLNYVNPYVSYNNNYYPSTIAENYPNFDIAVSPSFQVVTSLENVSQSTYRKQDFKYSGAVTNLEGLGFLGFRSLLKTNWYDSNNPIISSVSKNDISKRGVLSETFTVLGQLYGNFSNITPTTFIDKTNYTYTDQLLSNKVYLMNNTIIINRNGLEGTSKEEIKTFYPTNDVFTISTVSKNGTTIEQSENTSFEYYNNPMPVGTPYYIGLPKKKNYSVTYNNETMSSEEQYIYSPNLLLSQVKKKGNLTNYLTEDYLYDRFGNMTQKKTTAVGVTSPRIINYEFSQNAPYYGRFMTKMKDLEGLETNYDYDTSTGNLISEILPSTSASYLLKTSFNYDVWGKKTKETDYLGKSINYSYSWLSAGTSGYFILGSTGDDNSATYTWYDDLGRKIADGIRTINDASWSESNTSWRTFMYDIYDRPVKIYEPKLSLFPVWDGLFSTNLYDGYGRVVQVSEYTGKTTTTSFSGLTTNTFDGTKTVSTTKNSLGYVMNLTDNGGTISYQYFPNGNLKQTSFDGTNIEIQQDGWGRKTELKDPNAGIYRYQYNDFGELINEKKIKASTVTTPGTGVVLSTTTYDLNPAKGKLNFKTIVGQNDDTTNCKTSYTYSGPGNLLSSSRFDDYTAGFYTNYSYGYDNYKRLNFSDESGFLAYYQRVTQFDAFGRPEKELYTSYSTSSSKRADRWIKNTYKNGYPWQIIDDASNSGSTSQVLWQNNSVNAKGQMTNSTYGNGISINNSYDQYGFQILSKHDKNNNTNVITLATAFQPITGNLNSRSNSLFNWNENFQFDNLDRLTFFTNANGVSEQQKYNLNGSIESNNSGQYNYTNTTKKYQNSSVNLSSEALAYYKLKEGIFFDTMESKKGWQIYEPSVISFDSAFCYNPPAPNNTGGTVSLKINNPDTTEKIVLSEVWIPINNSVMTQYTYSAWVYSNSPQSEMVLYMKDEAGNYSYDGITDNTVGQWKYVTKTVNIPANIKKICLRLDNNGRGIVWFDNVKIKLANNISVTDDQDRKLKVSYNSFKSPVEIIEPGNDDISFDYNLNDSRSTMYYGGLQTDKTQRPLRKHYSSDGSMEIKENLATNEIEFTTYVGGNGYSAPVIFRSSTNGTSTQSNEFLYLHRDYQGSILAISNQLGNIVEKRVFDAWGNLIKVQDGQGNTLSKMVVLDRGYTGHEHLQGVALIHMNGRLYDPMVHRFLQPDNFVQNPYDTQNYNRYGYVLNNPLKYSDPSGEEGTLDNPYGGGGTEYGPGPSSAQQSMIGNIIGNIASNWDNMGIKDWSNRNFNFNNWNNQISSAGQFVGRNLESVGNWIMNNVNSLFGLGNSTPHYLPATPSFSNYQLTNGWQNEGFKNGNFGNNAGNQFDPPSKNKGVFKKMIDNPFKISEAMEAGLSIKQLRLIDAREALAIQDKIATFGKFSSKYVKYAKVSKNLGRINNAATLFNTGSDIYAYNNGNLSGARLSYRLGSTAASIGTSIAVGLEWGNVWGGLVGFVVGSASSVGELIYDGWNSSVLPVISQGTYQINNNYGWTNFHP
jgi:RHS repeat-associated protein